MENMLISAAKRSLKIRKPKLRKKMKPVSNKKWFDKDCRFKRHEVRKLSNQKHGDPLNENLREKYHIVLADYKQLLSRKQTEYYNSKITELEKSAENSDKKHFWQCLKSMDDTQKDKDIPLISEERWLNYFRSPPSEKPLRNPTQQSIINDLTYLESRKDQMASLDYFITENEIVTAAKRMKNNKSSFSDKIKNEMIKASLQDMMPVYLKLFNSILISGKMPETWCRGLITPIYKSGDRSDPSNYRGICVSSCLGKLFCSILNQRLLKHVNSCNILHNSQIGFLPNNRTADHVLTIRTLVDKYVHNHNEKIYACFVDFKKAFDSIWHVGLLYKLLQINVGGCFYNLIKSLYSNSTCSIKLGQNQTRPFQYARGVRQGCILSPLLFNLFINNIPFSFEETLSDPFVLPNGAKLNSLLYADDLVILSRSKIGLQNCLNMLSSYCNSWMLSINPKKTKVMIFQKRAKRCTEYSFHIDNENIEVVQNYTYLGTLISSTGNFSLALDKLKEKALHALFSLRKHTHISNLSPFLANKLFDAMISPILTYNSEIWGVYTKPDFKSWDSSQIEKAHLQYCKRYLEVSSKASNVACRAELGKFPLIIAINQKIINYTLYLHNKENDSIVKQIFLMSSDLHNTSKNSFYSNVMRMSEYYNLPDFDPTFLTDAKIKHYVSLMQQKYISHWQHTIRNSKKLEFYNTFKDEYTPSCYLDLTRKLNNRKELVKLRIGNHKLLIETGRYDQIPRDNRLCPTCKSNQIEDEIHLLFHCTKYCSFRDEFYKKIENQIPNITQLPPMQATKKLMNSDNYYLNTQLMKFILRCLSLRNNLLSNESNVAHT